MSEQPDDNRNERDDKQSAEQAEQHSVGEENQPPAGQGGQPPAGQGGQPPAGQDEQPPAGQGGQPPAGQGGQPSAGQGGQSPGGQGGQPPGGQGGQPPGGQGGQPPGGQGGQPPAGQGGQSGQAYGQPQGRQGHGQQQGYLDEVNTDTIQEWVVYVVTLSGLAGFGFGLMWLIIDAIDEPVFEADQSTSFDSGISAGVTALSAQITLIAVLVAAAVLTGAWLGRNLDADDQLTFQIAGAAVAAGSAIFLILSFLFLSFTFDNISVAFGGLILNTLISAIFTAGVAVGSVWLSRNQYPSEP